MQPFSFESIFVEELPAAVLQEKNLRAAVLRLDKIHPIISGNKWFKLKYYLEEVKASNKNHMLTFGGAYSNHIAATAAAGKMFGIKTTGIIRGERQKELSHTLSNAALYGMDLVFINRDDYRAKTLPAGIIEKIKEIFVINEGGYGITGAKGASEILNYGSKENYSHIACAVGTGTMMAGLIQASLPQQEIIGIPVLKNNTALESQLCQLLSIAEQKKKFRLIHDYHFGGYAKPAPELIHFMNEFYNVTNIPTDFVYTAKLFYAILDMAGKDCFPPGSNLLLIHSGGLQGNLSLPKGSLIF